jgi:thioredoxin reductase (NADPH)
MLVRRDVFRASQAMQKRALENPKIEIMWNTEALEAVGENLLTGVKVKNNKTNQESLIEAA